MWLAFALLVSLLARGLTGSLAIRVPVHQSPARHFSVGRNNNLISNIAPVTRARASTVTHPSARCPLYAVPRCPYLTAQGKFSPHASASRHNARHDDPSIPGRPPIELEGLNCCASQPGRLEVSRVRCVCCQLRDVYQDGALLTQELQQTHTSPLRPREILCLEM